MTASLSAYVHFPYCLRKCPYCDFNTYAVADFPERRYVAALTAEADYAATQPQWRGRRLATVFFGGGTPSLFSPPSLGAVLDTLDRLFGIEPDAELTMEANPGSFEGSAAERLRDFRAAGLNRVSFGAQSFEAVHLATLGRIHSPQDTVASFRAARAAGFENISVDLMFAIPGQTLAQWHGDLEKALALEPDHVSAYGLTFEAGTPFAAARRAGTLAALDEDVELEMLRAARERLGSAGFEHYEISNFARPGRASRHNLAYWTWSDYLGLGAGAHGFTAAVGTRGAERLPGLDRQRQARAEGSAARRSGHAQAASGACWGRRYANRRLPDAYMAAAAGAWHAREETLTREMAMNEYLMLGLRLLEGVSRRRFAERFGVALREVSPRLHQLEAHGLVVSDGDRVRLTDRGLELADDVIVRVACG